MSENEFSPEHVNDSPEGQDELNRIADEAKKRDENRTERILQDVIQSQTQLTKEISNLVGHMANNIAREALQPKLATSPSEVVSDPNTGGEQLAAMEKKVDETLKKADEKDKNDGNGAAKESKFSKLAAGATVLVGLMPFMQEIFRVFVKAANGTLTPADLANAGDKAVIMGLVTKWRNESDTDYWQDMADFYQIHNLGSEVGSLLPGQTTTSTPKKPQPTSADLVLILNLTATMNPILPTNPFTWKTAKDKADQVSALAKTYDATSINGKVSFIKSLANIKVYGNNVPRGIQATLGTLAVADKTI